MENPENPGTFDIKFDDHIDVSLKYWIRSSGIQIRPINQGPNFEISAFNSRGDITPGFIRIPINKLPELINDLTQLYNLNHTNHA